VDFDAPNINNEPISQDTNSSTSNGGMPPPINPEVNNLSATEQKEQTRLFAEAIVEAYAQYVPMIFTMICTIDMNKMKIHDRDGKLRLSMEVVTEEGDRKTVKEVFSDFNEKVQNTFVITPEMKAALLSALIPVLERRGITPSPEMTLGIVVVSQVLGMTVAAFALTKEKTVNYINPMMQLRKEEQEQELQDHIRRQSQNTPPPPPAQEQPKPKAENDNQNVSYADAINAINNPVPAPEKKQENTETITIEEVTEGD
jgi:hypothetical protein